jgi:hypothetical protein
MEQAVGFQLSSPAKAVIAWRSVLRKHARWLRLWLLDARFRGHDDRMNGKG